MKKVYKYIIILLSLGMFFLSCSPLMSIQISDGESCTIIIRGFNLMEFSAWSVVPILAILFVPAIIFSKQSRAIKEAEVLLLSIANAVCYMHSLNAAKTWLLEIGDSLLKYHYGILVLPIGFVLILLLAKAFDMLSVIAYKENADDLHF